ncbi:MAG: aminodeoxychorismate synthase component I [Myxococcota bacterium]
MAIGDAWLDAACDADGLGGRSIRASAPDEVFAWRLGDRGDPFEELERRARGAYAVVMLGYELGHVLERVGARARDEHGLPDLWIARYRDVAMATGSATAPPSGDIECAPLRAEMAYDDYAARVDRALDYIRAGDVYQVNLAHRVTAQVRGDPAALYARLRAAAPAPLGALVDAGGFHVLSNSPELFLRFDAATRALETRPIKGTRPRGAAPSDDARLRAEVETDPKERAEHVMIVDLERNDLGRVCETGSVRATRLHRVVTLPTLHHGVTTVSGRVRKGLGLAAILRATFPGGSITGAPKVRAMQIIDELEPVRRGLYTGAIGLCEPDGSFTLSIAIRTAIVRDGLLRLHVGGGIVADSTPENEWRETWSKAEAFRAALAGQTPSFRSLPSAPAPHVAAPQP